MSDIERHRGLLKLGGGKQSRGDLQHVFSSVGYAVSLGHDVNVDQLWLSVKEPLKISFSDAPDDFMVAEVLDESSAPAIAAMEVDEMLSDNPTPDQASKRVRIRDHLGELGDGEKDMLRDVMADTLRGMGGVALISSQTPEGLAVVRGFYEDTRSLGR